MKNKVFIPLIVILLLNLPSHSKSISNEIKGTVEMANKFEFITEYNNIKEYKLNNGLKVLLKENHSIPLVTFSIWYKVGSRNEKNGIRGVAHFLEHMMFKGTNNFKKGEISDTIQKFGGVFNAFTFSDGTAYYETVSPKYLEKMMEIESDRMIHSKLDEKELQLEKTVVLSELEGDLNNPASLLDNKIREEAYEKSPYKHPTIGYVKDIKDLVSKQMRTFYENYYTPNNATIIIIGDFEEEKTLQLISKYFGNIKSQEIKQASIPTDEKQKSEKRVTVKKAGVTKLIEIAFHIPDIKNNDIYALNIVEEILIKGRKSRLEKALVENGLATEVTGGAEANTDPGLFYIVTSLTPDTKHEEAEKIINKEINKLIKSPPNKDEITSAINRIKAGYLFNLDGTYNQAVNIGFFEVINDWKQAIEWPNHISNVTQKDVKNVLEKYFSSNNKVVGYFIPELKEGEHYEAQPINLQKTHHYKNKNNDVALTNDIKNIKYESKNLKDGSKLFIYKDIDLPITYITGLTFGGESIIDKDKEWGCELVSSLLEKGSKKYSKDDTEDFLDGTGTQIDFSCDVESFKFKVATLNEHLDKTIDIITDALLNPDFSSSELDKEKKKLIAELIEQKDNPSELAKRKLSQLIYPPNHTFHIYDIEKDIENVKAITRKDIADIHEKLIKNNKLLITLSTNISKDNLNKLTSNLEKNLTTNKEKVTVQINIPKVDLNKDTKKSIVFMKDKMQSDVFLGHAGFIKRTDPMFYTAHVANYILGGSVLTSRLARKVRDDSGLVYTVYSYLDSSHGAGEFGVYLGTNNENVDKAIELVKSELKTFVQSGVSEDELQKAKKSLIDSFVSRNLSSYSSITSTILGIEFYDLGKDYISNYPSIINSISLKDMNKLIKEIIHPDSLQISIAGEYQDASVKEKASIK